MGFIMQAWVTKAVGIGQQTHREATSHFIATGAVEIPRGVCGVV
jgi:hypothetical protein